jgi:hypothetical protein
VSLVFPLPTVSAGQFTISKLPAYFRNIIHANQRSNAEASFDSEDTCNAQSKSCCESEGKSKHFFAVMVAEEAYLA